MSTSAEITSISRSQLAALVDREVRRTGSRMVAYEVVAQTIGSSSSWVQKFIKRDLSVKEPRITLFQNIRAAYGQLCERVEQQNRADEARLRALKELTDEAFESLAPKSRRKATDRGDEIETRFRDIAG